MVHLTLTRVEYLDVCFELGSQQVEADLTHGGNGLCSERLLCLKQNNSRGSFNSRVIAL